MSHRIAIGLRFTKKAALAGAALAAVTAPIAIGMMNAPAMQAQPATPPAASRFEVVSIKPCKDDDRNATPAPSPGRLETSCGTVRGLIQIAYERYADGRFHPLDARDFPPIEGGPKWLDSERFAISAKADGRFSQAMLNGPMLQALLEDRFRLKLHRKSREASVYALIVAKGGSKLQPLKEGSCVVLDPKDPPSFAPGDKLPLICGTISGRRSGPNQLMNVHGMTLDEFSQFGMGLFGRPVINRTGITGRFDFHLEFASEKAAADDPLSGPSIFTAIQEQLGLKLVPAKGPVDFFVVDHVERPAEN